MESLRRRLLEVLREIEATPRADPRLGRLALGALLGGFPRSKPACAFSVRCAPASGSG